jgi:hypothetical protein
VFFQRLDRDITTSQIQSRLLRTTFVGCVLAIAAVVGSGVVGETAVTSRPALENSSLSGGGSPGVLALAGKTKPRPKVNVGSATQISADPDVVVEAGVDSKIVDQALRSLTVDWRSIASGWSIVFKKERSGFLGLTYVRERRVEIYVRTSRPVAGVAHDIAHELGHVADVSVGTDETRSAYLAARELRSSTPWWTCSGCTDLQVGAGDFAETFALLAAPPYKFYSELGRRPSAGQLENVVAVLPESLAVALRAKAA